MIKVPTTYPCHDRHYHTTLILLAMTKPHSIIISPMNASKIVVPHCSGYHPGHDYSRTKYATDAIKVHDSERSESSLSP